MQNNKKIILIAALLLGSASVALADGEFDPNLGNRYPTYNEPMGQQGFTAQTSRGFVQAPVRLGGSVRGPLAGGAASPGYHPNADLRYGPQPDYPQSLPGGGY